MTESSRAKEIIQNATVGSLGTLNDEGDPFVTLVTVAAVGPTSLAMLLSGLAKHTANLLERSLCSLLLVEHSGQSSDPMAGARLTLSGHVRRVERSDDAPLREAFLRQHPSASMYADFADFAFYRFDVVQAHLVAGFGRIETLPARDL